MTSGIHWLLVGVAFVGCGSAPGSDPGANAPPAPASPPAKAPEAPPPETSLGVTDRGIWSDLDARVQLALPAGADASRVTAVVGGDVLVVYVDGWPVKPYPLGGPAELAVGGERLALRPGDAAELRPLLTADNLRRLAAGEAPAPGDRDGDGLPDPLDVLIGARKAALEASPYIGGYVELDYPMGDVARDTGVCTDVVIRALRNAGLDLQAEVHRDIRRRKRAYPMVRGRGNRSIDHRRVKTILPWFARHADARSAALDDPADPPRPGDIVFMDTFPDRPGPDHIGVLSDTRGPDGQLLVINAWTDGYVTQEMELLGVIPITHRFRL